MRYEDILLNLAPLSMDYFDARSVSVIFQRNGNRGMPIPMSKNYPQGAFSLKRISADLDRLYRMNLLKRKRISRLFFVNRFGKPFGRGFMYAYKLSAQGWKYAKYLAENLGVSRQERKRRRNGKYKEYWNPDDLVIQGAIRRNVPFPAVALVADENIKKMPTEGIYNRFPIQFDEDLFVKVLEEKIAREKTKTELVSLTERAIDLAKEEKKIHETQSRESQSVLQLLMDAKRKAESSYMNPKVYLFGYPPANQPEASGYSNMPLLALLDIAIGNLIHLGYR